MKMLLHSRKLKKYVMIVDKKYASSYIFLFFFKGVILVKGIIKTSNFSYFFNKTTLYDYLN